MRPVEEALIGFFLMISSYHKTGIFANVPIADVRHQKVIIWGLRFTGEGLVVAKWNMLRKSVKPSQLHCQSLPRYFPIDSPQNAKFHQQPYFGTENGETDRVSSNHGEVYHFGITGGSTMTKVCTRVCRYFFPIPQPGFIAEALPS